MKNEIHPKYEEIAVTCSCGNQFKTCSTISKPLQIEVCSLCHPFYTGKQQKSNNADGPASKFEARYGKKRTSTASRPAEAA